MRNAIPAALRGPMAKVVTSFGDVCRWYCQREMTTADGSYAVYWQRHDNDVSVVLSYMSEGKRQRVWGDRTEGSVEGIVALEVGVEVGNILRPTSGSWCGQALEVVARNPIDMGTVAVLALKAVPDNEEWH